MNQFAEDVAEHQLTVLKDDGLYRHLRCAKPGSGVYAYEVTTWPGYLAITGDMGDYVFHRTPDMFEFFRGARVNPRYWQEKCVAAGREAIKEFDPAKLKEEVWGYFLEWLDQDWSWTTKDERREVWSEVRNLLEKIDEYGEYARAFIHEFVWRGKRSRFQFEEFGDCDRFTHHYLWCCHAIQWAIEQYDAREDGK